MRQKEIEWEETKARHIAQVGVLAENIQTLREDLSSEQKKRENAEQELEELRGSQLGIYSLFFNVKYFSVKKSKCVLSVCTNVSFTTNSDA